MAWPWSVPKIRPGFARCGDLRRDAVPAGALAEFPLIVPEPDAGVRQEIDDALRGEGLLNSVKIVLELGGWSTILAYVRDGFGVGVVSEAALRETKGLAIRLLDPEVFPRVKSKLICRHLAGSIDALDLSNTRDGVARGAPAAGTSFLTAVEMARCSTETSEKVSAIQTAKGKGFPRLMV